MPSAVPLDLFVFVFAAFTGALVAGVAGFAFGGVLGNSASCRNSSLGISFASAKLDRLGVFFLFSIYRLARPKLPIADFPPDVAAFGPHDSQLVEPIDDTP